MNLGQSNQVNPNAQANIQNPADPGFFIGTPTSQNTTSSAGLGFNPLFLLLALPFVFPQPFKQLRKTLKI